MVCNMQLLPFHLCFNDNFSHISFSFPSKIFPFTFLDSDIKLSLKSACVVMAAERIQDFIPQLWLPVHKQTKKGMLAL